MSDHHLSAHHHDPILGFSNYLSSPLSFSPPPPDRPFRTIRATDTSLPFPLDNSNTKTRPRHTSSSHPSPHYVRLQAETDERIASLEQALAEARESEDAQRKLAARLRRDFDKLQRDFERAERRMLREPVDVPVVATPKERDGWRRTENTIDRDLRATYARAKAEEERRIGWRSTAFPDFAPGPSRSRRVGEPKLGEVTERLGRMKVDTIVTERPTYTSMVSSSSVQQIDEMTSPGSTTSVGSTTVQRAETLSRRSVHRLALPLERRKVRKMVSPAKFAGPSKRPDSTLSTPLSPRLRVEVVSPPSSTFSPPHGSYRESPYPSPQPHATTASPTSLSSKIASMRTYVTAKLGLAASPTLGRTLGSELGSDFGDDRERRLRSLEDINPATSEDDSDQYSEPPAPLPPHVSAALSSLAIALAPHHDTSSPIPSKGSLREPGLEVVAYELLSEAVRVRRINWADTDKHLEVFAPNLAWGKPAESAEASEYPDEVSESNTALRPARLDARPRARPMAIRTVSSGTNTSLALAHRRRPSNLVNEIAMSSLGLGMDGWEEPRTIPAKVVHDLICLIAIVADCVEGVVVVLYRVMIDIRYGRRAIL